MNVNKKSIIAWTLVVIWMGIIFWFSQMDATESNDKSEGTINKVITVTLEITERVGLIDERISDSEINYIVERINGPLRKCMHASVYFILTLLLIRAFQISGLNPSSTIFFSLLICFIYACTDEIHQLFVPGRSGQFTDVLIDTSGGCFSTFVYLLTNKIIKIP